MREYTTTSSTVPRGVSSKSSACSESSIPLQVDCAQRIQAIINLLCAGSLNIIRHIDGLVCAWVWPPATRESLTVFAKLSFECRIDWAVGNGDCQSIVLNVPFVGQRYGRHIGIYIRRKCLSLWIIADEFQAAEFHAHKA